MPWVGDGISHCPALTCRSCAEERDLRVCHVDQPECEKLPERAICMCCGRALPCADTWPVIVWVRDRHGLSAVCNGCRLEYALESVYAALPRPASEESPGL